MRKVKKTPFKKIKSARKYASKMASRAIMQLAQNVKFLQLFFSRSIRFNTLLTIDYDRRVSEQ